MANGSLTWLGHATFRLDTPGGKRVYIDPWLENPKCPESEKEPERVDLIALTHGHSDHVGSTVELAKRFGCPVVAMIELRDWLTGQGLPDDASEGGNKGGTIEKEGVKITLTHAFHSSSSNDLQYLGEPAGLILELEDGKKIYFAGDTCVFGDMQLIGRIYEPDLAVLPIGDHYTMGPKEAAVALELLGVGRCVPCHYGTFPLLTGTPEACREALTTELRDHRHRARGDVRAVRERWFGATGRRVPEIAVEGEDDIPLDDALVVDGVDDVGRLEEAHAMGVPVVVRAATAEAVRAALERPEVACALVPPEQRELRELDFRQLKYG